MSDNYYNPNGQGTANYRGAGGHQNPRTMRGGANQPQFTQDFYIYSVSIAAILTNATSIQNIAIQADSDFEWIMTTFFGYESGATEPFTDAIQLPITVLITDAGSGRQLFSNPVPVSSLAGTGKQPFILPIPRRFKAKSTVTLAFTSFSTSTYDNIYFNMIGRKIFPLGAAGNPVG